MIISVLCNGNRNVTLQNLAMLIWANPQYFQPEPKDGGRKRRVALEMITSYEPPLVKEVLPGDDGGIVEPVVGLLDFIANLPEEIKRQIPKGALPQPKKAEVLY